MDLKERIKQILDKYEHIEANEDSAVNLYAEIKKAIKEER